MSSEISGVFQAIFNRVIDVLVIFGPIVGYIPQYQEIYKNRDCGTFSPLLCLILLTCNIMRIFMFFLKPYELPLLFQSFLMISAQLVLLELISRMRYYSLEESFNCLRNTPAVSAANDALLLNATGTSNSCTMLGPDRESQAAPSKTPQPLASKFSPDSFWNWSTFETYASFIMMFTATCATITISLLLVFKNPILREIFSYTALGIEACLALPLLISNYRNKSTRGLRIELILTMLVGDAFKATIFIVRKTVFPFILCAFLQLTVDFLILGQIYVYPK